MARPLHLITRFFGSLRPGGPRRADAEWAQAQLLPGEVELWRRMSNPDRRPFSARAFICLNFGEP